MWVDPPGPGAKRSIFRVPLLVAIALSLAIPPGAPALCTGDCDGDGRVTVSELVRGVRIALEIESAGTCSALDGDGNGAVTIAELVAAVRAAVEGCPPTPTATPSPSPTATATPQPNRPPQIPDPVVHRSFPGETIARPAGAVDPDGDTLTYFSGELPAGAVLDPASGVLSWVPAPEQLGPFYVPFTVTDSGTPPLSASGTFIFQIDPPDSCAIRDCDPASGCTTVLPPPSEACCAAEPQMRVPQATAPCPGGLAMFVGRNLRGFGRLQNCDRLRVFMGFQGGNTVVLNVETRCLTIGAPMTVRARLDTAEQTLFDRIDPVLFENRGDGWAEAVLLGYGIDPAVDPLSLEGQEANLTVRVTHRDGTSLEQSVRVVLTTEPLEDLPDP